MIGTIYRLKYLWSIKLMFCESKSRSQRGLDLTCRVESVSHSNCVVIQKDHVLFGAQMINKRAHPHHPHLYPCILCGPGPGRAPPGLPPGGAPVCGCAGPRPRDVTKPVSIVKCTVQTPNQPGLVISRGRERRLPRGAKFGNNLGR